MAGLPAEPIEFDSNGEPIGPLTLQQCADLLGLSKERVRQIEAKALEKLRRALKRAGLSRDDLIDSTDSSCGVSFFTTRP